MPVDTLHKDLADVKPDYDQIRDCVKGQRAIKAAGIKYLPKPNASDLSPANTERFQAYLARAVFYNFTARTVENMVGQCFAVEPVKTLPKEMDDWLADIDGAGVSIDQQAKKALSNVIAYSRGGLWVDYPKAKVDGSAISKKEAKDGGIRPKLILFDPSQITNWRTTQQGSETKLSLVVILENYIVKDDGFTPELAAQYRVLRLNEAGFYQIDIWREGGNGWALVPEETVNPTKGDGSPWEVIPFTFIGAVANDTLVEKPLMLDIANLNIAHFRNSADYEETVYMVGQPTLVLSGLSQQWVNDVLKGKIMLGSRSAVELPKDGKAELLQPDPQTMAKEAMEQKEKQAAALGAKLVEKSEVATTATENTLNEASETSVLASSCNNVSKAYAAALGWAAEFANIEVADPTTDLLYELNTEFAISRMSPEEVNATLAAFNGGLMSFEESRDKLKSGGFGYLEDDEAKEQMEAKAEEDLEKASRELEQQTKSQIEIQKAKGGATPPALPPGK